MWPAYVYLESDKALAWNCPHCDTRNYSEYEHLELSSEDCDVLKKEGETLGDFAGIMQMPSDVRCSHCGRSYPVVNHLLDGDDDDEAEVAEDEGE